MLNFYTALRASWVVNWRAVALWYYAQRIAGPVARRLRCSAVVRRSPDSRSFGVELKERADARQLLSTFSEHNRWNLLELPDEPAVIVDLGANRGLSALYWAARYPRAVVHGVEMDETNAAHARRLFSSNR